jgi:hypothetical protein
MTARARSKAQGKDSARVAVGKGDVDGVAADRLDRGDGDGYRIDRALAEGSLRRALGATAGLA